MEDKYKYSYNVPSNLIALSPAKPRSSSKLLLYEKSMIQDYHFHQLDSLLKDGDHLVFNNTKVLKAKLGSSVLEKERNTTLKKTQKLKYC